MKNIIKWSLFIFVGCCSLLIANNNATVIGIGKVGLTLALSLESGGYDVLGVDVSEQYVRNINSKNFSSKEPMIEDYLRNSKNFRATTSLKEGLDFSNICFILLSTTLGTDSYSFDTMIDLFREINRMKISDKHLVICSTVTPGFIRNKVIPELKDCSNITISYNPPFIAQGMIVNGLRYPDMVLIGAGSKEAGQLLRKIYQSVCLNSPYMAEMSVESAEIAKLALNCFVTAKIAFANLIGDIADESPGADKYDILKAVGRDTRIGSKYFTPGYGFGGPCFTRDNRAFVEYTSSIGMEPTIFSTTDYTNELHAKFMVKKLVEQNLDTYVFEDISYKENCPVKIIEASQKLSVAKGVAEQGKRVIIVDEKEVIDQVQQKFGDLFQYNIK